MILQMRGCVPDGLQMPFTCSDILFDALDRAAVGWGVKEQQQNGLQDSNHVAEGEGPSQPALSCGSYWAVTAAQAVHDNTQSPGWKTKDLSFIFCKSASYFF